VWSSTGSPLACGLWPVACGLWPVACELWPVNLWPVACGLWRMETIALPDRRLMLIQLSRKVSEDLGSSTASCAALWRLQEEAQALLRDPQRRGVSSLRSSLPLPLPPPLPLLLPLSLPFPSPSPSPSSSTSSSSLPLPLPLHSSSSVSLSSFLFSLPPPPPLPPRRPTAQSPRRHFCAQWPRSAASQSWSSPPTQWQGEWTTKFLERLSGSLLMLERFVLFKGEQAHSATTPLRGSGRYFPTARNSSPWHCMVTGHTLTSIPAGAWAPGETGESAALCRAKG